jgi:hypothetical protein
MAHDRVAISVGAQHPGARLVTLGFALRGSGLAPRLEQ